MARADDTAAGTRELGQETETLRRRTFDDAKTGVAALTKATAGVGVPSELVE